MKLPEILELLKPFGFAPEYVRYALAGGDSAHNAFERIKTSLQIRWGEMCQELSVEKQKELRPPYERLMSITMKSRTTKAGQRAEAKAKAKGVFRQMFEDRQRGMMGQRLDEVFDTASEYAVRHEEAYKRRAAKKAAKRDKKHPDAIDVEYEKKDDG